MDQVKVIDNFLGEVKIIDNFLGEEEYEDCMQIIKKSAWKYGHSSGNGEKFNNLFFAAYDLGEFNQKIQNKIEALFSKKFQVDRNYMHIQSYGQDGSYHQDTELENTFTFCIYFSDLSEEEIEEADGDFLLKIPNENFIICINAANNRGVFFPSTYFHKGMAYNKGFPQRRLCITWKLTILPSDT